MDLVELMYRYVNKFINSNELLKELKNIDISKYSKEEQEDINKLILDIESIKSKIPNEFDETEKNRISNINHILELLENAKSSSKNDEKLKKIVNKQSKKLLKDKKIKRDGGKLYTEIFELMTNNSLINNYANKMNDKELLELITKYISVPMPPPITQEGFNGLVKIGINEDNREALWRLAFNYNRKNINFSFIEDYFIEKRDDYYLIELISAVGEDLDMNNLIQKIVSTNDREFMNHLAGKVKRLGIITEEEIKEIKTKYNL